MVIQPKVIRIVHLTAFPTPKFGLTGLVTWIIQSRAMITWRQTTNQILGMTLTLKFQRAWSIRI